MISMNRGEELKPLSATASGGELSRLMLGLKEIFTRLQGIKTVIFDEIDTGVSGPVATAIGRKMKSLSKDCQVFSVTHLAQVAACADYHYRVYKSDENDRTRTFVKQMNEDEFIDELALISSGEITPSSLAAAKELLERNRP
jgi:DNA repair protein RecN (Recombination protein N)